MSCNSSDTIIGWFAEVIHDFNMAMLNGAFGVVRFIFNQLVKIPKYIKDFFVYGLPWLWKKTKRLLRYIFSGELWRLIWSAACFCPSLALFAFMFAWPFIGWYLTDKVDAACFSESYKWWWIGGGCVWTTTIGYYGVRYGIKNDIFEKVWDRTKEQFLPRSVRLERQRQRREEAHRLRVEEERRKVESAKREKRELEEMLERIRFEREVVSVYSNVGACLEKLKAGTITKEEYDYLREAYSKAGISSSEMTDMLNWTKKILNTDHI